MSTRVAEENITLSLMKHRTQFIFGFASYGIVV